MKRTGFLIEKIADRSNLANAYWKAKHRRKDISKENSKQYPAHKLNPSIDDFANIDSKLAIMSRDILSGDINVGNYHQFTIYDPKQRTIHAPSFYERVLHHAVINVCGDIIERGAIDDSYACRIGKGNHAAIKRAVEFTRKTDWYLKLDIRRFFDSIDHVVLKTIYRRLFKDYNLILLIDKIVDSYHTRDGKGLPIGALTSQYLANLYLDRFDRFVKNELKCRRYVRFMDDFVLWDKSPIVLDMWWNRIQLWLYNELQLELKVLSVPKPVIEPLLFLGFSIVPDGILLSRNSRYRFLSKLAQYEYAYFIGDISDAELQRRVSALNAHIEFASCMHWRKRLLQDSSYSINKL